MTLCRLRNEIDTWWLSKSERWVRSIPAESCFCHFRLSKSFTLLSDDKALVSDDRHRNEFVCLSPKLTCAVQRLPYQPLEQRLLGHFLLNHDHVLTRACRLHAIGDSCSACDLIHLP